MQQVTNISVWVLLSKLDHCFMIWTNFFFHKISFYPFKNGMKDYDVKGEQSHIAVGSWALQKLHNVLETDAWK